MVKTAVAPGSVNVETPAAVSASGMKREDPEPASHDRSPDAGVTGPLAVQCTDSAPLAEPVRLTAINVRPTARLARYMVALKAVAPVLPEGGAGTTGGARTAGNVHPATSIAARSIDAARGRLKLPVRIAVDSAHVRTSPDRVSRITTGTVGVDADIISVSPTAAPAQNATKAKAARIS